MPTRYWTEREVVALLERLKRRIHESAATLQRQESEGKVASGIFKLRNHLMNEITVDPNDYLHNYEYDRPIQD